MSVMQHPTTDSWTVENEEAEVVFDGIGVVLPLLFSNRYASWGRSREAAVR